MPEFKLERLTENLFYVTDKNWVFGLSSKERQFGLMFEVVDMYDATGDEKFEDYPILVGAAIMADKPHKSHYEGDGKPDHDGLLMDTYGYMGGVPVEHILLHSVNGKFGEIAKEFSVTEAKVVVEEPKFGTAASQGHKRIEYLQFKDNDAAQKFIRLLLEKRVGVLGMMIGFILDMPINLMGHDGWSVLRSQVNPKR